MRNHHALGSRGCATGVVDRQQIALANLRTIEPASCFLNQRFVIEPPRTLSFEGNEVFDTRKLRSNAIDRRQIISVRTDDTRAAVIDEVNEIVCYQTVIQRHQHRADLRRRVKRFELRVRVWREVSHAVTLANAELLQCRRPAIAAIEKLRVRPTRFAVDDRNSFRIELARPARKVQRCQRSLHLCVVRTGSGSDRVQGQSVPRATRSLPRVVLYRTVSYLCVPTVFRRLCAIKGTIFRGTSMAGLM